MVDADLDTFCVQEWPRLVGALSLYTGDAEVAQELAQETIARVCYRWDQIRELEAPGAWAHRVAINLAHSHFRRAKRGRALERRAASVAAAPDRVDLATALSIRAEVARLPHRQRAALVLRYYGDLPVRTVAEILRCSENTVKTLTARAIAQLRNRGLTDLTARSEAQRHE
jgi:RNA polymerase sigma factor (sigma-70 family)